MRFGITDQERYDEKRRIEKHKSDNPHQTKKVFAWLPIRAHDGATYWLVSMTKYTYWEDRSGFNLKQKSIYWSNK